MAAQTNSAPLLTPRRDRSAAAIAAFAPNAWDGPWMNRQQILSRLARNNPVFYSVGPYRIWERHGPAWKGAPLFARRRTSNGVIVDIPGKLPFLWPRLPFVDYGAIAMLSARWNRVLAELQARYTARSRIAYIFHPSFWPFAERLDVDGLVYHAYDQYSKTPTWTKQLADFESRLLQMADAVFASSRATAAYLESQGGRRVTFLPNGVDFDRFANCQVGVPQDLAQIPRPRVGYVGRINRKVDVALVAELARSRPDISFVLVGPVTDLDDDTEAAVRCAEALSNVYFLGYRDATELPAYMNAFDVGLLNYRTGESLWTSSIYPLKLHEYLACGLPIVSSELPALREFGEVVWTAHDRADWLEKIDAALAGEGPADPETRRSVAAANTWDDRVAVIESALESIGF